MKISYSADIIEDSGLYPLVSDHSLSNFFRSKDYGNKEIEIFFVINCIDFDVKNWICFDKKSKILSWDVVLGYDVIKKASVNEKKIILANAIINSFDTLDKYRKLNLDKNRIKEDAKFHFIQVGWLPI